VLHLSVTEVQTSRAVGHEQIVVNIRGDTAYCKDKRAAHRLLPLLPDATSFECVVVVKVGQYYLS
jgi:hypothetical protein